MEQISFKHELKHVVINYENWKDFYNLSTQGQSRFFSKLRLVGACFGSLFLTSIIIGLISSSSDGPDTKSAFFDVKNVGLFVIIGSFVSAYFVQKILVGKSLKRNFEDDPTIRAPQDYLFGDSGFSIITSNTQSTYGWGQIAFIKENENLLVLYLSKMRACVIPKKYFKEKEFILDYIKERIQSSKIQK